MAEKIEKIEGSKKSVKARLRAERARTEELSRLLGTIRAELESSSAALAKSLEIGEKLEKTIRDLEEVKAESLEKLIGDGIRGLVDRIEALEAKAKAKAV